MKQRERRKKNRSKRVLDPSTMARACGAVTWDEKQGGNRGGGSPQAGETERERFTCTFYLDVCQTRQSDRERERERQ